MDTKLLTEYLCCFSKPYTAFTLDLTTIMLSILNASNGVLVTGKDHKWFKQNLLLTWIDNCPLPDFAVHMGILLIQKYDTFQCFYNV